MSNITRRNFVSTAAAAAGAIALAGCNGNGNGSDAGTSASGSASTSAGASASGEKTKITFCLDYTPNTNHTGVYLAKARGYFDESGLDVEIVQPAEDSAETMLGTGQAQLGVSYQDYIANALAADNPMPIQAVAAIIQHNTSGIMSRAEDGITSAKGMEDHVYATWDMPVEQATIKQIVEADGGDYSKVQMVPYDVDDEIAGLKARMFDTVWVYEGWAVQSAHVQRYDVNYFSFISMDDVFDFYTPVIAANNDFCDQNPEVVKAFLAAVKRGYEDCVSNPNEAAKTLMEEVPELDAQLVYESQNFLADQYTADAASWGLIDADRWARYFQWLNDNGLVTNQLDVNAGWTMDYLEA